MLRRLLSTARGLTQPGGARHKVVSLADAVAVVHSGDTVIASGFVAQGAPEALLKALGERVRAVLRGTPETTPYISTHCDWSTRGLNHLALEASDGPAGTDRPMLRRTIGAHYGQTPRVAALALAEKVEAWSLPMGSISRMLRATASHVPGHITSIGTGTFVDPVNGGGKINQRARDSGFDVVDRVDIGGHQYLWYKALPVHVAFVRATTADPLGNLTFEHESLLADQRVMAMAARNSGGIVVAQVKRLASLGSLSTRAVGVPGAFVDAVVVTPEEDLDEVHSMSFFTRHDAALVSEVRKPTDALDRMPLDERKVIARRAAQRLKPGKVVNLGIGMPEGVASVAAEEFVLDCITLTTEAGAIGGLPASGHEFGPASNADALQEMNAQFDFYNGGGLDLCFLGAAQITARGDVNVSRLEESRLTGPGGFIDITQATRSVVFMATFTAKGLEVDIKGDGKLRIAQEGAIKKFVNETFEVTFSGDEAVRRGQKVLFVTERAVFQRTNKHDTLELIEIAPGIDLQRDVLDQMEFKPVISPELCRMSEDLFRPDPIKLHDAFFGRTVRERCLFHETDNTMFVDLQGVTISHRSHIEWLLGGLEDILKPLVRKHGPVNIVVNYEGFDCRADLVDAYEERVRVLQNHYYGDVRRYAGGAFRRMQLGRKIDVKNWDADAMFDLFDRDGNGELSLVEVRGGMRHFFGMKLSDAELARFASKQERAQGRDGIDSNDDVDDVDDIDDIDGLLHAVTRETFGRELMALLRSVGKMPEQEGAS